MTNDVFLSEENTPSDDPDIVQKNAQALAEWYDQREHGEGSFLHPLVRNVAQIGEGRK